MFQFILWSASELHRETEKGRTKEEGVRLHVRLHVGF